MPRRQDVIWIRTARAAKLLVVIGSADRWPVLWSALGHGHLSLTAVATGALVARAIWEEGNVRRRLTFVDRLREGRIKGEPDRSIRLSLDAIRCLATRALAAHGFDEPNVAAIVDTVVACERDESPSHGLIRIPNYIRAAARISPTAHPTIVGAQGSQVIVDGAGGFAPLAVNLARGPATTLAAGSGTAVVSLRNTHHMHALWWDVEPFAEAGLVALAVVATIPVMAAFGGVRRAFGTNPLALSCPRAGSQPITIDMASSAAARGDIRIAAHAGRPIPEGWAVDSAGFPTTEADEALKGAQLTFADHPKASNVALFVELLATALSGDQFAFEAAKNPIRDDGPLRTGATIIVFDPRRLGSDSFAERVSALSHYLTDLGVSRLPGDRRHDCRGASLQSGVPVRLALVRELEALACGPGRHAQSTQQGG